MSNSKRPDAMWYFLKRYKKLYLSIFFITVIYAVLEGINISILVPLFDTILNKPASSVKLFVFLNHVISLLPFKRPFMNAFILTICLTALKEIVGYIKVRLVGYGIGKVACDIKEDIFNKFSESDYQFFLDNKQGKLIYDLLTAPGRLGSCLQSFPDLVTAVFMTLTIGFLLFSISFKMTVGLMILGLLYSFVMYYLAKKVSYHIGTERVNVMTDANVVANELIDGIKHIKVSGSFDMWKERFYVAVRKFKDLVIQDFMWVSIPDRIIQLIPLMMLAGVAFFLSTLKDPVTFLNNNFTAMGVYIYAFYRLSPFLGSFGRINMQLSGSLADVEVLYEIIHKQTNFIKDGTRQIDDFNKEIGFDNISFKYKGNREVLNGISLVVEKGKATAIVGTSGSGKTTLINLMVRLFDPDSGRITIDGIDLKDISHSSLIRLIGMVSQDTFIFNGTIRDNIVFGLAGVNEDRIVESSKLANAHDFITGFPAGYNTIVGDKGLKLSGGQRQRIAIARAILRDPKILILDEATSSLDYHSEVVVQQAINTVSKNRTVVVVAHRLSTVINADKIIVLDHSRVAEEGTHDELMKRNGIYKFLYESQGKAHQIQPQGATNDERG